jgi:hypothetical protein
MGRVHQLITTHGFEEAKARALAKLDRQCIEAAFAVMTDEEQRIGVMHAGFSMTALPHKDIEEAVWTRRGGSVRGRCPCPPRRTGFLGRTAGAGSVAAA